MTFRREPTLNEVRNSHKSLANTKLARAIWPHLTWASYDKFQAHTWALRLINADPSNGLEVACALINFERMIPGATAAYETDRGHAKRNSDKVAAIFLTWKAAQSAEAAA